MPRTKKSVDPFWELQSLIAFCPLCLGHGYVLLPSGVSDRCSCLQAALYELRLSNSGIPPGFRNLDFKNYIYKSSPTYTKAWSYVEQADKAVQNGTGLVLVGSTKAGKTLLAVSILKELMKRDYDCGFIQFGAMIGSLAKAEKFVDTDVDFSCIDDVDRVLNSISNFKSTNLTHEESHGVVQILESTIAKRSLYNLPTILTSSVSIMEIDKKFPSLGTMLLGNFLQIDCVSDDFRGSKAHEKLVREFGFDAI